jgi:hypothetical protein
MIASTRGFDDQGSRNPVGLAAPAPVQKSSSPRRIVTLDVPHIEVEPRKPLQIFDATVCDSQ